MKKTATAFSGHLFLFILLLVSCIANAQNVGIGNNNPNSKLDVSGDINTSGQLKVNGQAGLPGQVLIKDAGNNPAWADLTEFKNFLVFDCFNVATSGNANDCSYNWTVPANATSILVECWGGGGGGGSTSGGGGGAFITARYTVTSGDNALIQVGAAGKGYVLLGSNGTGGGTSFFRINGTSVFAGGGGAGTSDLWASAFVVSPGSGGTFSQSGMVQNYIGWNGASGDPTRKHWEQSSATNFGQVLEFGAGGDAARSPGSGGKGGFYYSDGIGTQSIQPAPEARYAGGGGGAGYSGGGNGRGGRIIIRW